MTSTSIKTMKIKISLIICALLLIVPAARAQTPPKKAPWSIYTVKGERISIALPAVPALQTFNDTRTASQQARKRNILRCAIEGVVYTVHVVENTKPRATLDSFIKEQATANFSDNITPSVSLTFERDVTVDGVAGKAFLYPDKKGMVQFFAIDKRLYEFRAYGASLDDAKIQTFFHYLSLKKQDGAIEVSDAVQAGSFDPAPGTILKGKEVDRKVRLISKPEPSYTGKAKEEQITGTVVLKCVFASDGTVTNIRVIQGLPHGLTEKAIEAARKIKFIPATKDGKNVSMWMQLEYNFNLY
jgi:TonB family protein